MEMVDRVLKFITDHKAKNDGNSPPYRRIAKGTGLASTSTVKMHLDTLEELGLIKRDEDGGIIVIGGKWIPPETEESEPAQARREAEPQKVWGLLSRVPLEELRRLRQERGLAGAARACGVSPSVVKYHLNKAG